MDWHKVLYEMFGLKHPVLSAIVAAAVGAVIFGFIWHAVIGGNVRKAAALEEAKKYISLKERATSLSKEILEFLTERRRGELPLPARETFMRDMEARSRYDQETLSQYSIKFGAKARLVCADMKEAGITDPLFQSVCEHPNSSLTIQMAGELMGMFAEKIPASPSTPTPQP